MVAYSFKARFALPILDGTKDQTIRADRKRHARPGEALQLYTGMRTKNCRLIARATCLDVLRVYLDFKVPRFRIYGPDTMMGFDGNNADAVRQLDTFAKRDGFQDWTDMESFWKAEHDAYTFEGVLIRWRREAA